MLRRIITAFLASSTPKFVRVSLSNKQSSNGPKYKILNLILLSSHNNARQQESDINWLQKSVGSLTGIMVDNDKQLVEDNTKLDNLQSARTRDSDEPQALDDLREFYARCRKEQSSDWRDYANRSCYIYVYRGGGEPNSVIAAFDLDGTLIKPKSNKRIPRSATDWDLFSVWTKSKLQQVVRENDARFLIFTNQNGIGLDIVPLEDVQKRIELVTKRLDIPCTVFMAVEKDRYRKPMTGMFELFEESFNESHSLDYEKSFYCGDAVGYPSHSDADIKFAQKLGLPFLTPEKFLRGVKPKSVS